MSGKRRRDIYNPRVRNSLHVWNKFARDLHMSGYDQRTGERNEHRVAWILNTQAVFARYYAIEIRTMAVLGNHQHLVIENRPDIVTTWSDEEVVERWLTITKLKISGGSFDIAPTEKRKLQELSKGAKHLKRLRKRLADPSWYMGSVSECISRQINREEDRKGTCWQGRFKCRVARDDNDVLQMMMYVDLNPIRAGVVERVEDSIRSGAGLRLQALLAKQGGRAYPARNFRSAEWLSALYLDERRSIDDPMYLRSTTGQRASDRGVFWFPDVDYYQLLDLTARKVRDDKPGATPATIPPILARLGMTEDELAARVDQYAARIV